MLDVWWVFALTKNTSMCFVRKFNLMGLDLSLTSTGYSCGDVNGVIASKLTGVERLIEISENIIKTILNLNVDIVLIEGYSFASRSGQAFSIGELGGVVRVAIKKIDKPYIEIPPTCRAKFATGRGNASKNEVISAISARTGIVWGNPGADDKCDAWILEQMGLSYLGLSEHKWPDVNLSALEKVDWGVLKKEE
jgi:Holliday junction resolvasome RuvABC endonuclease subunit